jgi:hypothetical protein
MCPPTLMCEAAHFDKRKVNAVSRTIATLACAAAALALPLSAGANNDSDGLADWAGTGAGGYAGDGGLATDAELASPHTVAPATGGGYLIADTDNNRIRKVAPDGKITTVAGTEDAGFNGDALPATMADLDHPEGVAATPDGGFLIADTGNHRIRKVLPGLGVITTVAGTGTAGDGGLGLAASLTELNAPTAVAPTRDGGFLIADYGNDKIRKVSSLGLINTVAGGNGAGFSGDGGQATDAQLACPHDVAVTDDGGFLIADSTNNRIRKVAADGTIDTVAGNGNAGSAGDDGDPLAAELNDPLGVAVLAGGGFLIADTGNDSVRRVKNGTIKTKADSTGVYRAGSNAATQVSQLDAPEDVLGLDDGMLVADTGGHRVRLVGNLSKPSAAQTQPPAPATSGGDAAGDSALSPPSSPTVGGDLNVARTEGTIRIKLPGSGDFVRLDKDASIPFGSIVDAASGTVTLTTAHNRHGVTQSAAFKGALFRVTQKKRARPVTDLELRGGDFGSCRATARKAGAVMAARSSRRARRHLWGSGHGRFRTIGRHGAATVRGTIWLTADRCDGTLVRVRRGRVEVRDFRARKTVFVRAGHSYFARKHARHHLRR